jgi:hypothetical protein
MKNFFIIILWVISLFFISIYTYENPELIDVSKNYLKKNFSPKAQIKKGIVQKIEAIHFDISFSKIIALSEKTAFVVHNNKNLDFDENLLKIYTQNGYLIQNLKSKKINLPNTFTINKNGGIKSVFTYKNNSFALISSLVDNCYYSSIVLLEKSKEVFKTKCLPDNLIDYNGLGSSTIHFKDSVLISIGAPEQASKKIALLAQNKDSMYGKILQISFSDLEKVISNESSSINPNIYSIGHRNPQGLTKLKKSIFSVEHGPRGGDELNKITEGKNYGWPISSYGTKYSYDKDQKKYQINHENNNFEEPLFALVPSVGISSLNRCPTILKKYYKKPCLLALSLLGNKLRPGRSVIIYLLDKNLNKVHSIEKIILRDDLKLRHFVTDEKNELFEDKDGSIYIAADKKGIYKINFINFRN